MVNALFKGSHTYNRYKITETTNEKAAADYTAYDYSPDKPALLQDKSQPIKELYLTDKGINEIRDRANELFYQFMHDKAVLGVFDLSNVQSGLNNHMVGIGDLPEVDGIFSQNNITITSKMDGERLKENRKVGYSVVNLKEISVIEI